MASAMEESAALRELSNSAMTDEDQLLLELMLQAEVFCNQVETAAKPLLSPADMEALRLKISQCRAALSGLQRRYEEDKFGIADATTCADFRTLTMLLLWVNFLGKEAIDHKTFRKLLQIQSGFSFLLIGRPRRKQ